MTTIPAFSRITGGLQSDLFLQTYQANMQRLMRLQLEVATGRRVQTPSDDAIAMRSIMSFEGTLGRTEQYLKNASDAQSELSTIDGALSGVYDIVTKAKQISLALVSEPGSADLRRNASVEIRSLFDELVNIANSKYADRYVFGGYGTTSDPFELGGDYNVTYAGTDDEISVAIGDGLSIPMTLAGSDVFGSLLAKISGTDLNPALTLETKLKDLNNTASGAAGVRPGRIEINLGTPATTYLIDLTGAEDVEDVKNLIENGTSGNVTVNLNGASNGLELVNNLGGAFTAASAFGAKTAEDLGIAGASAGPTLTGTDLDPRLTALSNLADLLGGGGALDLTGISITNNGQTANIGLSGAGTVEEFLSLVNGAGISAVARIKEDGRGVEILSAVNGSRLSISEMPGGTTAAQMGLLVSLAELPMSSLKNGMGIDKVEGNDFAISLHNGSVVNVDIGDAGKLQDIVDAINNDAENDDGAGGNLVTASVNEAQRRIELADMTAGASDFKVERLSGAFTAANLGIEQNAGAGGVINGTDLSPVGIMAENLFSALYLLMKGLESDDTTVRMMMSIASPLLDEGFSRIEDARATAGARMNRLEMTVNRLEDGKTSISKLLSDAQDADMAEAAAKFTNEQTILEAALASSARISKMTLLDYL
jgi:flagellar hook-associated protein 3 FlgL